MRTGTRPVLFVLLGFLCAWAASPRAHAGSGGGEASLRQVRYWCSEKYTRVVFDLDREVDYQVGQLGKNASAKKPARIYVDLRETLGSKEVASKTDLTEGPVQSIRAGRFDRSTTRLVLDLRHMEDYNVFQLEEPFRIVLDLWWNKNGREGQERQGTKDSSTPKGSGLPLIVLDPGHGGHDPGATGKGGLQEKEVALGIALSVKEILEGQNKARVILTRDRDEYLPLERRAWIANSKDADLFVSVHANAHPSPSVSGVETYYLDNTTDRAAMRVAALENDTREKRSDALNRILIDLRCNVNAWESNELAHTMQGALVKNVRQKGYDGTRDLGVKGSLFYVLIGAHMPSILVEVAFITNPAEEKRLKTRAFRQTVAEGIARGITEYLQKSGRWDLVAKQ